MLRLHRSCAVLLCGALAPALQAGELPADYFKVLEAQIEPLRGQARLQANAGALFAAAVLYAKKHPANRSAGDRKKLELALALGDLYAGHAEADTTENKQDYEWELHF